ncbi:MAG: hypothetical protein WCF68_01440 [Terriglobales bacterium]
MNHTRRRLTLWTLVLCLILTVAMAPALASAQAISSGASSTSTTAKSAAPASSASKSGAKPTSADIAAAKASGKVWVNTETGVYHKGGRWYGKTKAGQFMTELDAKAAGFKAAKKE